MEKLDESIMTTAYSILVLLRDDGIQNISASELMHTLHNIKTSDETEVLAKKLTKKNPELYDAIHKIIYKNTISEKQSLDHWNDLAFDRV
jgi:hypothetical protein